MQLKKIFLLNLILISSIQLMGMDKLDRSDSLKDDSKIPRFDIHIGAGFANGGRAGLRYLVSDNFSIEAAYGINIYNFFMLSNFQRRYTLGINYHFTKSNFTVSFLSTYVEQPNSVYQAVLLSPNFGIIPIRTSGLEFFIRAGFYIEILKSYPTGNWKGNSFEPNLDIGISYNF